MAKLGEAFVEITARLTQFREKLRQARSLLDQRIGEMQRAMNRFAGLEQVGRSLTVGLTLPLIGAGFAMLNAASRAEETRNRFEVAFKEMTDRADAFTTKMKEAQGVSIETAQSASASFFLMARGFKLPDEAAIRLSETLTRLAFDLSSFQDLSREEAVSLLQSGLSGQIEPLRRFNVFITEATVAQKALQLGLARTNAELTQGDRFLARVALILEQTTEAQGDAVRTADSFAGQVNRLKGQITDLTAELGQGFIPTMVQMIKAFNLVIVPLVKFVAEFLKAHPIIATVVAVLAQILIVLGPLVVAFAAVGKALAVLAVAFKVAWAAALGPIGLIIGAIVGLVAIVSLLIAKWDTFIFKAKEAFFLLTGNFQKVAQLRRERDAELAERAADSASPIGLANTATPTLPAAISSGAGIPTGGSRDAAASELQRTNSLLEELIQIASQPRAAVLGN